MDRRDTRHVQILSNRYRATGRHWDRPQSWPYRSRLDRGNLPPGTTHEFSDNLPSKLRKTTRQILLGDDLELRAYASMTYARCLLASGGDSMRVTSWSIERRNLRAKFLGVSESKLKETRPHLIRAIKDYRTLSLCTQALEALYTLSVVCHNLDLPAERDNWATQFHALDEERKKMLRQGMDEDTLDAFWVIREAGYVIGKDGG